MDKQDDTGKEIIDENKDDNKSELFRNIALLIIIVANIFIMFKLANMGGTIEALRQELANLNSTVDDSINNVSSSVESALRAEASIINEFNYEFGEILGENVLLNLKVSPKEYSQANTYSFSYTSDGKDSKTIEAEVLDGQYIVKDIEVPIKSFIALNYIVEKDGVRKIEKLLDISKYEEQLLSDFQKENRGTSYSSGSEKSEIILDAEYVVQKNVYDSESPSSDMDIKSVTTFIAIDGKVIDSFPMKKVDDDSFFNFNQYSHKLKNYKLDLNTNQPAEIYAVIDLDASYKVRINLDKIYSFSDNDGPVRDPNFYMEEMYIIFED